MLEEILEAHEEQKEEKSSTKILKRSYALNARKMTQDHQKVLEKKKIHITAPQKSFEIFPTCPFPLLKRMC